MTVTSLTKVSSSSPGGALKAGALPSLPWGHNSSSHPEALLALEEQSCRQSPDSARPRDAPELCLQQLLQPLSRAQARLASQGCALAGQLHQEVKTPFAPTYCPIAFII